MSIGSMTPVGWDEFYRIAKDAGVTLPPEQSIAWDAFDEATPGRSPWGRVVYRGGDGAPRALLALTRMEVRGFPYLWAKHGPVWLGDDPSPEEEADLRELLIKGVRHRDRSIVFVRLHAMHAAPDCHELLQTKTFDRTIILNLDRDDDEAILASFKSRGRRDVRKALRNESLTFADETDRAEEVFDELYAILTETGERDGFRAAPKETYLTMLRALGPEHARLYVARENGGPALAWGLPVLWEDRAIYYYAASSHQARRMLAADALLYKEACWLHELGVRTFDLMGIDSERAPELAGVRMFKSKFTQGEPVEVAGAWDVPVRPRLYAALVHALNAKHTLSALPEKAQGLAGKARGGMQALVAKVRAEGGAVREEHAAGAAGSDGAAKAVADVQPVATPGAKTADAAGATNIAGVSDTAGTAGSSATADDNER
ncbi:MULTISPECIES: GNAT family N-acetyltransferase [unclassified Actinobaculum]|uniref:lipid II:glycine glycyltransferase FemX n=1 Tax=unclassified Actinobaculum TaxID=2609299 RepID=UPI000D52A005|nr:MULTISPECIES: GNAT family N-acetyltransferase [unclassified Actinobaculum]AWE41891.1 GNAT family N-acetyltransferase [Actinobaculum sp. 313]RTE50193.1 peptidoglycan bridge formation glycyltransferase FemA/FemB family protein [Actinobaculum sp. 352]